MVSDVCRGGTFRLTLFDEVGARLPLFDDVPDGVIERLSLDGFGRGLLTASLRTRLRKGGFSDMGALALASPADLMAVRKIGPLRVDAIRTHLLGEFARRVPSARADHGRDATDRRRLDRLHTVLPSELGLDAVLVDALGPFAGTCADLALRRRAEIALPFGRPAADVDRIVAALIRILSPERKPAPAAAAPPEDEAERAAKEARERADRQRDRDREWEEAAPERGGGGRDT